MQDNNQIPSLETPKTEKKVWVTPKIEIISKDVIKVGTTTNWAEGVVINHTTHFHYGSGS